MATHSTFVNTDWLASHRSPATASRQRGRRSPSATAAVALVVWSILLGWTHPTRGGQLAPPPQRIVTVIPAVTEILFAVGADAQIVGIGSFDELPAGAAEIARVGGLLDPDMEQILALRPDLVVLYESQTEQAEQLQRAGIPLMSYSHAGLADIVTTIRSLGERTGHLTQATSVATRLTQRLDAVRARVRGRPRPRTLLVFSREPLSLRNTYASGGIGFLHDMLDVAGGDNVFADIADERVAQLSAEAILTAAPTVILEIRNDGGFGVDIAEQERAVWRSLPAVPAVVRDEIHFLAGSEFVVPGPRVVDAIEQIARLLHPDAF